MKRAALLIRQSIGARHQHQIMPTNALVVRRIKGVKDVIITVGSKGVCARLDGELIRVPAFKVKAVDTTAAGDTFCGALCVALSQGKSLPDAILFGNKAASISVTRRGAQMSMPHLDEVEL